MDWTPYVIAMIMSIPGYLTVAVSWKSRQDIKESARKLETVHALINGQSEKLNEAIKGKATAEGELKGRSDAAAEQIMMVSEQKREAIMPKADGTVIKLVPDKK